MLTGEMIHLQLLLSLVRDKQLTPGEITNRCEGKAQRITDYYAGRDELSRLLHEAQTELDARKGGAT